MLEDESAGLFHDSVDVVFDSKDIPMGLNLFDFQGRFANYDMSFIDKILTHLPNTFLLVQVSDVSYMEELNKLPEATRRKFA